MNILIYTIILGVIATFIMDVITWIKYYLFKTSSFDYALLGRWFLSLNNLQFFYNNITQATSQKYERATGWLLHYVIGVILCFIYIQINSTTTHLDSFISSIVFGFATTFIPLTIMQPILGFVFFANKTPAQWKNIKNSVIAHLNFGVGLFIAQLIMKA